ncbi:MAG: hypothetical protein CMJ18_20070 [Phycisphaeraceae bacterium]|nr:hypothetical protein [Phycisphaeraceae bacterium]
MGLILVVTATSVCADQVQTLHARLAQHSEKWHESPQNGIPCMQTYSPRASLVMDVVVPEPGAVYQVSLSLVKVTNGGHLKVFVDDKLQTEVDTYLPGNAAMKIPICNRFMAPGTHSIRIRNVGQTKATGGDHLSIVGLEIVRGEGAGAWRLEKTTFTFTPLDEHEALAHPDLRPSKLPPRQQEAPFSIPSDAEAAGIFAHSTVRAGTIPFRITDLADVPETGHLVDEQKPLEIDLPGPAREIFLLIWSKIPPFDGDAGPSRPPIAPIDESERFTARIVHADGTSSHVIPFDATKKRYGLDNGLSLYVLHPDAGRSPKRLVFHDKVDKCSFAVVAVTCNSGDPLMPEPTPRESSAWYPPVEVARKAVPRRVEREVLEDAAGVRNGIIAAQVNVTDGLRWSHLGSPVHGDVALDASPVFAIRQGFEWIGSDRWHVAGTEVVDDGVRINLEYRKQDTHLSATLSIVTTEDRRIRMGLSLVNSAGEPFQGRVRFPILEGVKLGPLDDTWYYFPGSSGAAMINHVPVDVYASHGAGHPHQVDSFFNPKRGFALTLLSNDLKGQFHWYDVGKAEDGGWYRLEYLEKRLERGATWELPECIVSISPGDWRESFRQYRQWVGTWYRPKPAAQDWYTRSFVTGAWYVYSDLDELVAGTRKVRDLMGYCDIMVLVGWHGRMHPNDPTHHPDFTGAHRHEYSGEYDRDALFPVGGADRFRSAIRKADEAGIAISPYTNGILINENTHRFGAMREKWGIGYRPVDYGDMMGYVPCLAYQEWADYFVDCQRFLAADIGMKVIYLDQFGGGSMICKRKDHPHEAPEPHFDGERRITRRIREAIPADVAICSEAHPEDTRLQFQNAFYQGGVLTHVTPRIRVPVNMTRFAFPDVKCFNYIYNYILRDGNWERLKFVMFNGDAYNLPRSYDPDGWYLPQSTMILRKMFRILNEHADAFTSRDVEPLVPTEIPGTFVNRFGTNEQTVWTVFNANHRTARGRLIEIAARPGARYADLWNDTPVTTRTEGETTWLVVEVGPRDVACITRAGENQDAGLRPGS